MALRGRHGAHPLALQGRRNAYMWCSTGSAVGIHGMDKPAAGAYNQLNRGRTL